MPPNHIALCVPKTSYMVPPGLNSDYMCKSLQDDQGLPYYTRFHSLDASCDVMHRQV